MAKLPSKDVPQQGNRLAPTEERRGDPIDEAGEAVVALVHQAHQNTMGARDAAFAFASQIAAQLRAVEDRIKEFEAEIEHYRGRAANAEDWMKRIQGEINNALLKPPR